VHRDHFAFVRGNYACRHTICRASLEIVRAQVRTIFHATLEIVRAQVAVFASIPSNCGCTGNPFFACVWNFCLHKHAPFACVPGIFACTGTNYLSASLEIVRAQGHRFCVRPLNCVCTFTPFPTCVSGNRACTGTPFCVFPFRLCVHRDAFFASVPLKFACTGPQIFPCVPGNCVCTGTLFFRVTPEIVLS
jgi:hypothetical protein